MAERILRESMNKKHPDGTSSINSGEGNNNLTNK